MPNNNQDPKLQNILNQLARFGFSFYGFDENKVPLVISPNKQVVQINLAINFVNQQIESQRNSGSSSGPESMPSMPTMNQNMDSSNFESNIDTKLEKPSEQRFEKQTQQVQQVSDLQTKKVSPPIKLVKPMNKGFGDGFDPKSFNPEDINSTLKFIEKNSSAKATSSNAWLAKLFKKFMSEYEAGFHRE